MFWAKNSPVPEASTDFGVMSPPIVFARVRFPFHAGGASRLGPGDGLDVEARAGGGVGRLSANRAPTLRAAAPGRSMRPLGAALLDPSAPVRHNATPVATRTARARK